MGDAKINSRAKGQRFERHIAGVLAELWPHAKRGFQARNGSDAPDVDGTPWWVECKHGAAVSIIAAYDQAAKATRGREILIIARANRGPIVAAVNLAVFDSYYPEPVRRRADVLTCSVRIPTQVAALKVPGATLGILEHDKHPPLAVMRLADWMELERARYEHGNTI
jgi:hypothetical protein